MGSQRGSQNEQVFHWIPVDFSAAAVPPGWEKDLFNREIPPEKTFQRQITIEGYNYKTDLNTTSIVVLQKEEESEEEEQEGDEEEMEESEYLYLLKRKDFWI